jgi:signal transduction histidine kinase
MLDNNMIYKSLITLKFDSQEIETSYQQYLSKNLLIRNKILHSTLLAFSITIDILVFYYNYYIHSPPNFFLSIITTCIICILFLITLCSSSYKIHKTCCYLVFIISNIKFEILRYFSATTDYLDLSLFSLFLGFEQIYRIFCFFFNLIDFFEGFLCFIIMNIMNTSVTLNLVGSAIWYRSSIITTISMCTLGISYFYVKEKRKSFYLNSTISKKNQFYQSILDNMSSGFVLIKDGSIEYMNKILKKHISVNYINTDELENDDYDIFNKVLIENLLIKGETKQISEIYEYLRTLSLDGGLDFNFIGKTTIKSDKGDEKSMMLNFEVFGRMVTDHPNTFELLFNDVTRVKFQEEENADFKYKTLFLSKVAHEFKNPLLCITELVEQIKEEVKVIEGNQQGKIFDILKQINSVSDYLFILIKDLDYFSQKNFKETKAKLDYTKVKLDNIMQFCHNIVYSLLKKLDKEKSITFNISRKGSLPSHVFIDEIKLKQVLVNLLSNSVKYTFKGKIELITEYIDDSIKFTIKDTGKGLSDTQKSKLFIPFSIDNSRYFTSAGLGLYIVKEIIELMDSAIYYKSEVGMGTEFWFSLNIKNSPIPAFNYRSETAEFSNVANIMKLSSKSCKYLNESIFSMATVGKEFNPNTKILDVYFNNSLSLGDHTETAEMTAIIVDDEDMIRKSTIRQLKHYCEKNNININIIEAYDGIECIYYVYKYFIMNKKVSFVISDENMSFMNGSYSAEVLNSINKTKGGLDVRYYLLSAYENLNENAYKGVRGIFTKPLSKKHLDIIFNEK